MLAGPGTALLLDAANTLLLLREPVGETYARVGRAYGVSVGAEAIGRRFRTALRAAPTKLRRVGDGRPFWAWVVAEATGCADRRYLEALYAHYAGADAWSLAPGARGCCEAVRSRGMRTAIVSNWDTRLRPLLRELQVDFVDELAISGEEGVEKPDARLFRRALARLGVAPARAVHVGDDPEADGVGARAAGCSAWILGVDVGDLDEVRRRLTQPAEPAAPTRA